MPESRSPIVFVADASAEAERVAQALKSLGYIVESMTVAALPARIGGQRPNVVIVDVDPDGIVAEVTRLRRTPGAGAIDFVYLGTGVGTVRNADDALLHDGSAYFPRPIDVGALARKIEALTGGPAQGERRA